MARQTLEISTDEEAPVTAATNTRGNQTGTQDNQLESQPEIPAVPALELVVQPGNTRRVRFDGDPAPTPAPEPAPQEPAVRSFNERDDYYPSRNRQTLFRTPRGGEVVAYGGDGRRDLALTGDRGMNERRWDSSEVDAVLRNAPVRQIETDGDYLLAQAHDRASFGNPVVGTTIDAWEPNTAVVTPAPAPTAKPAKPGKPATYLDYKGDSHPVIELEGIGAEYAGRLENAGVLTTARLCWEDAASLSTRIDVPEKTIRSWQAMAQLIKVNGIGKQYSEVLARAGVANIPDLLNRVPEKLADRVESYLATLGNNPIGQPVTATRIATWQKTAKKMRVAKLPVPEN